MANFAPAVFAAALLILSAPAAAAPEESATVVVFGDDPCPDVQGDEIVVCARRPESERYRIPKELRDRRRETGSASWASRFEGLEEAARHSRPNSCSPVGTWGQTGCAQAMIRQWFAERRAMRAEAEANSP